MAVEKWSYPWRFFCLKWLIPVFAVLTVFFLSRSAVAGYKGSYPYKVGATVGMVADIVREVAGDKAKVTHIIGTGVDPHIYNPARSDVAVLVRSDIIFYAGLLLEGQMANILVKVSERLPVFAVTELLKKDYLIQDPLTSHHDPHVWMDVGGWIKAVDVVTSALAAFDPAHSQEYRSNASTYRQLLKTLNEYARKCISSIPVRQRLLITAHDAFNYMSRAYGIEVLGIQGISTESEAGLRDINRIVGTLVRRKIPAVFVESSVSDKNVRALIEGARFRGHKVFIGGELFSDAMGPDGTYEGTYVGMIDHNITTITRALGGKAVRGGMQGKLIR
ncbi:MAG: zinc ABC transporter solute-binding protein [Desulfobacteraceae bacterium]|nr:zinc ABC transporter solute-binding protein [Desulfobacteraceae bacterium]